MKIHLCTGLPRSGSTILLNILQQNPRIFTSSTCVVPRLLNDLLTKTKVKEEFMAMEQTKADKAMYGFARGATYGWYEGLTDKPVAFFEESLLEQSVSLIPRK